MSEALNEAVRLYQRPLVAWLHYRFSHLAPWQEIRLILKPLGDAVYGLVTVGEYTEAFTLPREQQALAEDWQRVMHGSFGAAWLTVGLISTTLPGGRSHVDTFYNYDKDPGSWSAEDPAFAGEDLAYHLARFPRRPGSPIPEWMRARITDAGLNPGPMLEGEQ